MEYKGISNATQFRARQFEPYALAHNVFTNQELDAIIEYTSKLEVRKGLVATGDTAENEKLNDYRKSNIAFFTPSKENEWIFKKLNITIEDLNAQHYNFILNGYDALQYTEYNASYDGKYDWHMDCMLGGTLPDKMYEMRKLSFSVILNEPNVDFEGGNFELMINSTTPTTIVAPKGTVIFFPSFMIHRVSQLTKGKRKSLVGWVTGPKFR